VIPENDTPINTKRKRFAYVGEVKKTQEKDPLDNGYGQSQTGRVLQRLTFR